MEETKNQLKLAWFCCLIGAFAGTVIWWFLKIMAVGMEFLWERLPEMLSVPYYTLIICTLGGALIGLFRKQYGDYPEELETVLGKIKKEKHYGYKNMPVLLIAALLPLLFGSSVGPEAGLTGIIVALCYWAGDNLKFAQKNAKAYSEIGTAVTLSLLFYSPLFGFFAVEENQDGRDGALDISKSSKIFVYGLAIAAGSGAYMFWSSLLGAGMSGFPAFDEVTMGMKDYILMAIYVAAGCILALFYEKTHHAAHHGAAKLPPVIREITAGFCLGLAGMFVPAIMFSGEEQMAELMIEYGRYLPWMLIGVAFLKILITNICIQFGMRGGHFFPMIFAGVCMGYGIAAFVFPDCASHVAFAAAMVTASLLGGIMKKPLAVTVLLFLCFPAKLLVWIFMAAAVGNFFLSIGSKKA